jgi:hypothetical protein
MEIVENARDYNGRTISGVARTDVHLDVVRGSHYQADAASHQQRSLGPRSAAPAAEAPDALPDTHGLPGDAQLQDAQAEAEGLGRGIKMMRRGKKTQPYAADV